MTQSNAQPHPSICALLFLLLWTGTSLSLKSQDLSSGFPKLEEASSTILADAEGSLKSLLTKGIEQVHSKNYHAAMPFLKQAITQDPKRAAVWLYLGHCQTETGASEEAILSYQTALKNRPDLATDHKDLAAAIYNNRAAALYRLGRYGEMAEDCQKALSLRPKYAPALNNLGVAWCRIGQHKKAAKVLREASGLLPENALTHAWLGVALAELGDFSGAIKAYQKGLLIQPALTYARYSLATCFLKLRDYPSAIRELDSLRREAPQLADELSRELENSSKVTVEELKKKH